MLFFVFWDAADGIGALQSTRKSREIYCLKYDAVSLRT